MSRILAGFQFPSRLYPIVDLSGTSGRSHLELARSILRAGAPLIQLRMKGSPTAELVSVGRQLRQECDRAGALLIVNDRTDVAVLIEADGVHLGQDDLSPAEARRLIGPGKIIGLSTHDAAQAERAARDGVADYVGFGPIFATASKEKPDPVQGIGGIRAARRCCSLPMVAIGGIDRTSLRSILAAGADAVAVIGAVSRAADPCTATRELMSLADGVG